MLLFAGKKKGQFWHIYPTPERVKLCGVTQPVKVDVAEIPEPKPGCYWGWRPSKGQALHHIYPDHGLVKMCSPDGFKAAMQRGEGVIVPVQVCEVA